MPFLIQLIFGSHYFPPTCNGGGKSYSVLRFFYKFCQISTLLLHLVNSSHHGAATESVVRLPGRHEVVGWNPTDAVNF